jgi:hypothetical protein
MVSLDHSASQPASPLPARAVAEAALTEAGSLLSDDDEDDWTAAVTAAVGKKKLKKKKGK